MAPPKLVVELFVELFVEPFVELFKELFVKPFKELFVEPLQSRCRAVVKMIIGDCMGDGRAVVEMMQSCCRDGTGLL